METKKIEIEAFEYIREDGTVGYAPLLFEQFERGVFERWFFIREDANTAQKIVDKYNARYLDPATGERKRHAPQLFRNKVYGGCTIAEWKHPDYQDNQSEDAEQPLKTAKIEIDALEYVREDGTVGYAPLIYEFYRSLELEHRYFIREDAATAQKIVDKYNEPYLDPETGERRIDIDTPVMWRDKVYGGCMLGELIPGDYRDKVSAEA